MGHFNHEVASQELGQVKPVVFVSKQLVKTPLKPRLHLDPQTHHLIVDGADDSGRRIQAASRTLVSAEELKATTE